MACHPNVHHRLPRFIRAPLLGSILLLSALLAVSWAQVTLDGSIGPLGPLAGPHYRIDAEMGQIRGSNLFHSFDQFMVRTGESATFTGPNTLANILSRVTGGQPSAIAGLLRSEISGANLCLINPSGVLFGRNASLDISRSFHVSTADHLCLADGAQFFAKLGQESVLTVAATEAIIIAGRNREGVSSRLSSTTQGLGPGGDLQVIAKPSNCAMGAPLRPQAGTPTALPGPS
jgi:filamentous hemagglutinin family protein